jgi:hypothetical protein
LQRWTREKFLSLVYRAIFHTDRKMKILK